ncbi:MAG: LysM peptidoglycan-binding domain-containing M23 family metallopeptidase [Candidatus Ratteibacteria bacterium]|nr:LysM peptidoglycan-binding domain-containing M23 family metallopeptidase [Candidatus Ratteibacteria bacterium]
MRKLSYILFVILLSGCAKTVYKPEKPQLYSSGVHHRIEKGETLWRIAKNYGADIEQIKIYNNIKTTENLQVGRVIFIPFASLSMEAGKEGFIWPAKGKIISDFDCENGGISKGIDVSLPIGSQIRASREGTVSYADVLRGYGKVLIIDHTDGFSTIYAHNSKLLVEENSVVEKGELIAFSGNSGHCESPLLHFEIRKENIPQNPLNYLP